MMGLFSLDYACADVPWATVELTDSSVGSVADWRASTVPVHCLAHSFGNPTPEHVGARRYNWNDTYKLTALAVGRIQIARYLFKVRGQHWTTWRSR